MRTSPLSRERNQRKACAMLSRSFSNNNTFFFEERKERERKVQECNLYFFDCTGVVTILPHVVFVVRFKSFLDRE